MFEAAFRARGMTKHMSSDPSAKALGVYTALLDAWNRRDADAFAALFASDGHATGFDGSQMAGPAQIATDLHAVFDNHPTASYVAKVRFIKPLGASVVLLHAVAGMIPPDSSSIAPKRNAIQTLILKAEDPASPFRIVHFQNTPAAFDGRPQLVSEMTEELTRVYEAGVVVSAD